MPSCWLWWDCPATAHVAFLLTKFAFSKKKKILKNKENAASCRCPPGAAGLCQAGILPADSPGSASLALFLRETLGWWVNLRRAARGQGLCFEYCQVEEKDGVEITAVLLLGEQAGHWIPAAQLGNNGWFPGGARKEN